MVKLNKRHVELREKNELFMCIVFFQSGWGKGFIWYYLGVTLSFISSKFYEISSQRRCTFSFHQNKDIFTKKLNFVKPLLLSLIKALQYKMIQKANSISVRSSLPVFFPVTSTSVRISPKNFLAFASNPFATLL